MRELVESIGKANGFSPIDIYNCYARIDYNVGEIVKSGIWFSMGDMIIASIRYSTSLKLQREYKNIIEYIQDKYL